MLEKWKGETSGEKSELNTLSFENYLKTNFGEIMLGDNQHNLKKSKTTLTSATW